MDVSTLEPGAFSEEQAARITGLTPSQLAYWSRTGLFPASHTVTSGPFRRIYSFRDLVGLRTLASLRAQRVSLQELRKLGEWLRREHETPWSSLRFWIGPKHKIYFSDPGTGTPVTADDAYQGGIPVALEEIAARVRANVSALQHRAAGDLGVIRRTRNVMGNAPVFAGTRIPVQTVRELIEDGANDQEILREFPTLVQQDIDAARERRSA